VISRHPKWALLLLLPLLIARGLLPAGFMVSFDEGVPRLVFCSASSVGVHRKLIEHNHHQDDVQPSHHGHEHDQSEDSSHAGDSEHGGPQCPFALSAAAPLAFTATFIVEPLPAEAHASPSESPIALIASRAHPIRGPPALS
jgi:hypothetical protein